VHNVKSDSISSFSAFFGIKSSCYDITTMFLNRRLDAFDNARFPNGRMAREKNVPDEHDCGFWYDEAILWKRGIYTVLYY
jgi:hypothetical protein